MSEKAVHPRYAFEDQCVRLKKTAFPKKKKYLFYGQLCVTLYDRIEMSRANIVYR